jgi:chemotaxis signal transduction protein
MSAELLLSEQVAALRLEFDQAFAHPPPPAQETEDYLAIEVSSAPYAIRLRDVAGVLQHRLVLPVPSTTPALLGLAGHRGGLLMVFGLSTLLGYPPAAAPPGWLLLCGGAEPLAFAFDRLEGYLRLPKATLHEAPAPLAAPSYATQVIRSSTEVRPLLDLPRLVATARRRDASLNSNQEH